MRIIFVILAFFGWVASLFCATMTAKWGSKIITFPGWIKAFQNEPKPIESNILVDPAKVGEIIHRWNTWEEMLDVLKTCMMASDDLDPLIRVELAEIIKKAEER
jgi:hypothetical protein